VHSYRSRTCDEENQEKEHAEQARAQAETVDLSEEDQGGLKVRAAASEGEAATSLSAVRVVVLDEVDMLLDGSFEGTTKEAIKGLRKAQLTTGLGGGAGGGGGKNRPHRQRHGTGGSAAPPESRLPQFVLAGATIPDRGKRSVRVWIERIFRGLTEVADDALHTATHNVTHRFVPLYPNEVESRPPAVGRLKALHRVLEEVLSDEYYIPLRGEEETRGGRGPRQREKKILIFTNTVDLCCAVNAWLGVHHATAPPLTLPSGEPQESDTNGEDAGSGVGSMEMRSPALRGVSDSKVDELLTSVGDALGSRLGAPHLAEKGAAGEGEASSAAGVCLSVGMYHKKMSTAGRAEALSTFQAGSSRSSKLSQASSTHASVLVCTDAASRGLDFTDVTHVIQADMAQNVVDHLHRLGRMARTGGSVQIGCGISLVTDNDSLLVDAIERAAQHSDDKDALGREAFSRRRGLRKRERKKVKDNRKE
jgi:superfamily II DNA/RNA helicase